MCRSISLLSKITHQMRHDHPFSQRNRSTEGTVGVGVGGDRGLEGVGGLDKIWKRRGRQYRMGLHIIVGFAPLWQLCKETLKSPHPPHYKNNPLIPDFPPFLVKSFDPPHYCHFWKISPPLHEIGFSNKKWGTSLFGISQASIFGPFLFNVFMWDFENNYFTSNVDETTPNVVDNKTEVVLAERNSWEA